MQQRKQHAAFAVDGYAITASFADCKNAAALHHVKQILLSSFANNTAKIAPATSLQSLPNRGIIIVGVVPMYLENFIFPAY